MFRRCVQRLGVSPFLIFVKESAGNAALAKLAVPARGKKLGQLYAALSAKDKAALVARAKATTPTRKPKAVVKASKVRRALSPYNKFVKANWSAVKGKTAPERMKAIAKLWAKK